MFNNLLYICGIILFTNLAHAISISNVTSTSTTTNVTYKFNYTGIPTKFHFFIDTDKIVDGYYHEGIKANFLVENGYLYKYSGLNGAWGWKMLRKVTESKSASSYNATLTKLELGFPGSLRVVGQVSSPPAASAIFKQNFSTAKLIFKSGFEDTEMGVPYACSTTCWQDINGENWPVPIWGNLLNRIQLIAGVPINANTIKNYVEAKVVPTTGRTGASTSTLYQVMHQRADMLSPPTQAPIMIQPDLDVAQGDLYVRYWIKLQSNLAAINKEGWGRMFFQWKAGDYRVSLYIKSDGRNGVPTSQSYWILQGDDSPRDRQGDPITVFWQKINTVDRVPAGEWMKFEYFHHRSLGSDGRVWAAINGKTIVDHRGPNMDANRSPIDRLMLVQLYQGSDLGEVYQWTDDVEVWNGFPSNASPH